MTKVRYNNMDALRSLMMLLGLVIHAAAYFRDDDLANPFLVFADASGFYWILRELIHSFRMDVFYVLSGFLSFMILEKHTTQSFIVDRLIRLGVPLLLVGGVINYLSFFFIKERFYFPGTDYFSTGRWLVHLWFLANLIIYSLLAPMFYVFFVKFQLVRIPLRIGMALYGLVGFLFLHAGWRLAGQPTLMGFFVLDELIIYFPSYLLGGYFWLKRDSFIANLGCWKVTLLIFLVLLAVWKLLTPVNSYAIYALEVARFYWVLTVTLGLLQVFSRELSVEQALCLKEISNSSYTIYLFHLSVLLGFAYLLRAAGITNPHVSFVIMCVGSYTLLYLLHQQIKDNRYLMFVINGKRFW
ncbi:acyltransferase family protein [Aliagarivorans marinus]|uniref:acyltransferase family protein n=1 Tax=Aliagarivorans marinus TaxID=561965 RepID=UPI000403728A|nr:acyltransferase family protein [Aliagarivorans marinus]